MSLLRYDVSVHSDGKEKVIHKTESLSSAAYMDDVSVHRIAWHWHEEFELLHLLDGNLQFLIGTTQFRLRAGEALFINSQMLHGAWDDGEPSCPYHSVVFHPQLVGGSEASIFWRKYVRPVQLNQTLPYMIFHPDDGWQRRVIGNIEEAWQQTRTQESGYEFAVRSALSDCILQIWMRGSDYMTTPSEKQLREEERVKKSICRKRSRSVISRQPPLSVTLSACAALRGSCTRRLSNTSSSFGCGGPRSFSPRLLSRSRRSARSADSGI